MAKYRALLGDRFLEVDAGDEQEAQEIAFAKLVRDLTPRDFTVWPTGPGDEWGAKPQRGPHPDGGSEHG